MVTTLLFLQSKVFPSNHIDLAVFLSLVFCYDMESLLGYRFRPTSEELVHFLNKKNRDPAFTDLRIKEINLYEYHPCELPGLSSLQSDEQIWYFFCTLDQKYPRSERVRRTAKGGSWKVVGKDRVVKDGHSNEPIGFKKTLVFYQGCNFRKEYMTNWVMHEYHQNKNPVLKGKAFVCSVKRKQSTKHGHPSAFDEEQSSYDLAKKLDNLFLPTSTHQSQ